MRQKSLGLKKGMNVISFSVRSSYSGFAICTSRIFLWESDYQVVISDIDGTITKSVPPPCSSLILTRTHRSDALGHVFTMIGRDWTHLGVAKLYTDIARNGYKMMYLTSRAIGQADTTREYLRGIKQNGYQLPEGPVIMSPDRLMTSLHRFVLPLSLVTLTDAYDLARSCYESQRCSRWPAYEIFNDSSANDLLSTLDSEIESPMRSRIVRSIFRLRGSLPSIRTEK